MTTSAARAYDAPELADRYGDTVQSDIFSFGCMLWELLADGRVRTLSGRPAARRAAEPGRSHRRAERGDRRRDRAGDGARPGDAIRVDGRADRCLARRRRSRRRRPDARSTSRGPVHVVGSPACGVGPDVPRSRRRSIRTRACARSPRPTPKTSSVATTSLARSADALAVRRLVAVVGPSGSGKSSVVDAGLVPLLRGEGARIATMVPGDRPCESLRQALRSIATGDTDVGRRAGVDRCGRRRARRRSGPRRRSVRGVLDAGGDYRAGAIPRARSPTPSPAASAVSSPCAPTSTTGRCRTSSSANWSPTGRSRCRRSRREALEEAVVRPARRQRRRVRRGCGDGDRGRGVGPSGGFATAPVRARRAVRAAEPTDTSRGGRSMTWVASAAPSGAAPRRRTERSTPELQAHARELFARLVAPGMGSPDTPAAGTRRASCPNPPAMSPIASSQARLAGRRPRPRHPRARRRGRPRGAADELAAAARMAERRPTVDRAAPAPRKRGADVERDR